MQLQEVQEATEVILPQEGRSVPTPLRETNVIVPVEVQGLHQDIVVLQEVIQDITVVLEVPVDITVRVRPPDVQAPIAEQEGAPVAISPEQEPHHEVVAIPVLVPVHPEAVAIDRLPHHEVHVATVEVRAAQEVMVEVLVEVQEAMAEVPVEATGALVDARQVVDAHQEAVGAEGDIKSIIN